MSFRFQTYFLAIGRIFGLKLNFGFTKNLTNIEKIESFLIFLLLSALISFSANVRYHKIKVVHLIMVIVFDISHYGVIFFIAIYINYKKISTWNSFTAILKKTDTLAAWPKKKVIKVFNIIVILIHIGFMVCGIIGLYNLQLSVRFNMNWLNWVFLEVHLYIKVYTTCLMYILTDMIWFRYKRLKSLIEYYSTNQSLNKANYCTILTRIKTIMYMLKKAADLYQNLFGILIVLIVCYTIIINLLYIHNTFNNKSHHFLKIFGIISAFTWTYVSKILYMFKFFKQCLIEHLLAIF